MAKVTWRQAPKDSPIFTGKPVISSGNAPDTSIAGIMVAASVVATMLLVGACSGSEAGLPAGAVEVDTDLYMVPLDDGEGPCRMWRMYSPTLMTTQVIHYQKSDGGFAMSKTKAGCN